MAKVKFVKLALNDKCSFDYRFDEGIVARSKLKFDKKEVKSGFRYQLHFFIYENMGRIDQSTILFEDTADIIFSKAPDQLKLLAHTTVHVCAKKSKMMVEKNIDIQFLDDGFLDGLRVRALLVPDNGIASKWSNSYFFDILLK